MQDYVIERLGHHGDGIAPHPNAGPVFVPRTLPGERVTGSPDGDRLTGVKILEPSEHRVAAPCRHAKSCGGCQLQHASDEFVEGWKQSVVQAALTAQGLEAEFRPVDTSPSASRRRATFALRRTKKGALWGFHGQASHTVVATRGCQLVLPELLEIDPMMQDLAQTGGSRKGEMAVTVTKSEAGLDVFVTGGKSLDDALRFGLSGCVERHGLARLTWDDEVLGMRARPEQRFGDAFVTPPAGAFLQATAQGEAALLRAVLDAADGFAKGVDLFAGCGTFTLPLAKRAEMHAVEGDRAMTEALNEGWRNAAGLKHVSTEARDLFRRPLLPDELNKFDVAVLDPPRAGAAAQIGEIVTSDLTRIAYVSCNPVTFARDAAVLVSGGFVLDWVQVVDQFRWSAHVELAAQFTRGHIKPNS